MILPPQPASPSLLRLAEALGAALESDDGRFVGAADAPIRLQGGGHTALVQLRGETLGLVDVEDLSLHVDLSCRCEAVGELDPRGLEREWMEDQMRGAWDARGYEEDQGSHPGNGWDPGFGRWILNLRRSVDSLEALAEEVRWAADQDRHQFFG